jgi:hypothetical protein
MMIGRRPDDDLEEPDTAAWQERVWLVWPHCGQVAVFPGDMLHGVMPLPIPITMPATQMPTLRQTVLINLWAKRPQGLPLMPPELAPCLAISLVLIALTKASVAVMPNFSNISSINILY